MKTFFSPRKVILHLYTRTTKNSLLVSVGVVGEAHIAVGAKVELSIIPGDTANIEGQWVGPQKPLIQRVIPRLLPGARVEAAFPLAKLPAGDWCIRAVFIDRHGHRCHTQVIQDKLVDKPAWLGSAEAVDQKVPPPWTPLRIIKKRTEFSVSCWGRNYTLDNGGFVRQIQSLNEPLLSGPVKLIAHANGHKVQWHKGSLECRSSAPNQVVFSHQITSTALTLNIQTEIDFDGMLRVDWELSSSRPIRMEALIMEIPLQTEYAKYFYQYRGRNGDDKTIGLIPRQEFAKGFRPFIWIGDESRGMSWFAESDENWFNADPHQAIIVKRERDSVILRLQMISTPVDMAPSGVLMFPYSDRKLPLVKTLRYTFGLQATPVKPVEKDAWDYRIFCITAGTRGIDQRLHLPTDLLDRLQAAGVRTVVIFEHWTDMEGHAMTTHAEELKKIIRDCHQRGMQVLFYFGFLLSDLAPEWRDFGTRCVALPKAGWSFYKYPPQPEQTAWRVCYRSPWQDFLSDGIASVMKRFDIDGVYLDGTAHPNACRNMLHGCGVVQRDGSITPTFPIFAVRSTMRRIYAAVRSRKPQGQVNVHNSTCMTMPTMGFATSTWDGEQFAGLEWGTPSKTFLTMDAFRTEFMGHQWGVPAEFLCPYKPRIFQQVWALSLLHDVPVRPALSCDPDDLDFASTIWKVMDQFGRKEAKWLPYWRNKEYVKTSSKETYASLYLHPQNGVLTVLSNLSTKPTKVTLSYHLGRLGLSGKNIIVTDGLTGNHHAMTNNHLQLSLPPITFKLLWLDTSRPSLTRNR